MLPEGEFFSRVWVLSILERAFWILFQDILDLFGPCDNCAFKDMGFIFRRRLLFGRHILRGKWEHSSAIDLSDGHVDISQEIVELVHQILGN